MRNRIIGLFCRSLDVIAGDWFGGMEIRNDTVEVFGQQAATKFRMLLAKCEAILGPLIGAQTGIDGALCEQGAVSPSVTRARRGGTFLNSSIRTQRLSVRVHFLHLQKQVVDHGCRIFFMSLKESSYKGFLSGSWTIQKIQIAKPGNLLRPLSTLSKVDSHIERDLPMANLWLPDHVRLSAIIW